MVTGNDRRCAAAPDCSTCDCIGQICAGGTCSQDNGVLTVTCPNGS